MHKVYRKLSMPYIIWLIVLVFIPTIFLMILGFTNLTSSFQLKQLEFTFDNLSMFKEISLINGFKNSLLYATLTTLISFIFGYLLAYIIYRSSLKHKFLVILLLILPMWSNLILRIDALANIMSEYSILTDIIGFSPLAGLIGTPTGILFGMVSTYIPFMVLPIYSALEKIDIALDEASSDLGLTSIKTFMFVTFPLSLKGVVTGAIMVFLPTFSGFAIPKILSQGRMVFLGNIIENKFNYTIYNDSALISSLLLVFILIAMFLVGKFDKEGEMLS